MIDITKQSAANDPRSTTRIERTSGELFEDGSAIELLMAENRQTVELLLATGDTAIRGPELTHNGVLYKPIELNSCMWRATRLPDRMIEYGSPSELFSQTAKLLQERAGFARSSALLATSWTASTWLYDSLISPPPLLVSGTDMDQAVVVFSILSLVVRRPILLAELGRAALHKLIPPLGPTLLVNSPHVSRSVRHLCQASNYAGVFTLGNQAELSSAACSKAIFVGSEMGHEWAGSGIHLQLPASSPSVPLNPRLQAELANYFQPRWLKYRLDHSRNMRATQITFEGGSNFMSAAVRQLEACVQGQEDICRELEAMGRSQEDETRAAKFLDPSAAIIEVLWALFHAAEKPITVGTLTNYVNTLLAARGGIRKYDAGEIGTLLSGLCIGRRRKNSGVYLTMDQHSNGRIHKFAAAQGVGNPSPDCPLCQAGSIKGDPASGTEEFAIGTGSEGGEGGEGIFTENPEEQQCQSLEVS